MMTQDKRMDRRRFLLRSAALGCSAAASPLFTPVTLASTPDSNALGDHRLVVIILRGGMDGLDALQPHGDAEFGWLRPETAARPLGGADGAIDLDGYFALHPGLAALAPLWRKGELGFVNAVSTPYRDKRSHFDGQDMLEAGTSGPDQPIRDGWLNRLLQAVPGVEAETAYAVGRADMLLTRGAAPVADWSPDAGLVGMSPQSMLLLERIMHDDPVLAATLSEAMALSDEGMGTMEMRRPRKAGMAGMGEAQDMAGDDGMAMQDLMRDMQRRRKAGGHVQIAEFAAQRLKEDTRIATFSVNGWDTHANQDRAILRPMSRLSDMILAMKGTMGGPVWNKTAVLAMTEFGRTAALNGTRGTDHGTGGLMVMAGGAIRGAQVAGRWPGLAETDLYDRRDLMPTSDVRAHVAWVMRGLFGLERSVVENAVFPGLDSGSDVGLLR